MKLLIYVDNFERLNFFEKIVSQLDEEIVFITNKLSVYYNLNKQYKKYLIKKVNLSKAFETSLPDTLSTVAGYHTMNQAKDIYISFYSFLEELYSTEKFEKVFIWNGSTTFGYTLNEFCKNNTIDTVFFEISNLDGKIFADKKGVNAKSFLYENPEILDSLVVDEVEYAQWLDKYKSDKKTTVRQAKNKSSIKITMLFDYIGYYFLNVLREDFRNPLSVIKNKLQNRFEISYENANLDNSYIFFPLQVSNDSQVILNSDFDNLQTLKEIVKKYPNNLIYIKIHPAEPNKEFIREIFDFVKQYKNIKIVGNNTKDLIINAEKVVVINSTVGLEALILEKEIEVYGRALYKSFNQDRLKAYIQKYLINIDYFDDGEASKNEVKRILSV